jgi:hypothetical protein
VSLTAIGNTTFCEGNQITLLCNQGTGTVWSNGAIDVNSSTISSSGSYSVSFTDNNGCFGTSNAIDVTVNANPTVSITANGPTTFCNGGSVTLSSSATGNNSWTGGSSANSIDVSASGTYELTYTDVNGCQAMTSTTVTVNDQPTADFSILQNNGSLVIQFLNNSNNATSYSWDFGDGTTSQETNPSHLYNAGGNYTVTLTATNGDCVDTFVFDVMNVSTDELSHLSVSVYPNPASQQLTLIAPAQSQLIIFDVTGKMVMSILTQQTNTEINLNDFSAGLYFVKGYNAQGFFTTKFEKR